MGTTYIMITNRMNQLRQSNEFTCESLHHIYIAAYLRIFTLLIKECHKANTNSEGVLSLRLELWHIWVRHQSMSVTSIASIDVINIQY